MYLRYSLGLSPPSWFDGEPTWPVQPYYDEDGPPVRLDCKVKVADELKVIWFIDQKLIPGNSNSYPFTSSFHYENMSVQYEAISKSGKKRYF